MPSFSPSCVRFLTTVLVGAAAYASAAPSAAAAPPSISLRADWYVVTTPYRYDVGQRYASGWHRGADARPAGGVVRAVTGGVVRFVGAVAGRRIVTVHDRARGIVVTYVGLDGIGVHPGQRVTPGLAIGRGDAVHVGAYDDAHRERYVPIVGGVVGPGAVGAGGDDSLSGAVVGRLRDAALGEASAGAAHVGPPVVDAPQVPDVLGAGGAPVPRGAHTATAAKVLALEAWREPVVTSTPGRPAHAAGRGSGGSSGAAQIAPSAANSTALAIASLTGLVGFGPPASGPLRSIEGVRARASTSERPDVAAPGTRSSLPAGVLVGAAGRRTLMTLPSALIGGEQARVHAPSGAPAAPTGAGSVNRAPSMTPMLGAGATADTGSTRASSPRPPDAPRAAPHRRERWSAHPLLAALAGCALLAVVMRALRRRRGVREEREDQVGTRAGIGVPLLVLPQSIEPGSPEFEERAAIAWSDPPPDRARIPEHA